LYGKKKLQDGCSIVKFECEMGMFVVFGNEGGGGG
jgi:hypothetical protein